MKFIPALHGLRGLAAMTVLFSHLGIAGMVKLPFPHDRIGKAGVWIFFVLSAYLLSTKVKTLGDAPGYMLQRFFRIYPLYFAVLLLNVAVGHFGADRIIPHLLLLDGFGGLWAIPVEFRFYLIAPVAALLLAHFGKPAAIGWLLLGATLSLASPGVEVFSGGHAFLPRALPFVVGTAIALWPRNVSLATGIAALFASVGAVIAYRAYSIGALAIGPHTLSALLAVSVGALVLGIRSTALARIFGWKPLVWLGEVSFSVYLLHTFFIEAAIRLELGGAWVIGATLACAAITYELIERPGIALGRRIAARLAFGAGQTAAYSK